MNYGMDCFCSTAVRLRGLISEKRSKINLEKMWLLVELFDNGVLLDRRWKRRLWF
jgi:hypothetical protein